MKLTESVEDFYSRVPKANPSGLKIDNAGSGHFNIFSRENCSPLTPYSRRDFYKVSLILGTGKLHYADKWILIDRPALLFSNPIVPYSWEAESALQQGWFCLFTEAFIQAGERQESLQDSPLFRIGSNPVFFIDELQQREISAIFLKMMKEINSDYTHKYSMLRNYLHLIIHESMKMSPAENFEKHTNASSRITTLFIELLERQFPVDTPHMSLKLKTAADFAKSLSIHVNHLNRSVKELTGKTTTEHIASRITREAKALLQHTDWNISEIAYGLGFEYPAYFTNFFKKNTGISPIEVRQAAV